VNERTYFDPRCTRQGWPAGLWDQEPDKVEWRDADTGLACIAKRQSHSGHWCGYVGVAPNHPWHGKGYGELPDYGPECHGGLTYAAECPEGPPDQTVCHIPAPGEPAHLWWFGFDCHHAWDLAPYDYVRAAKDGRPVNLDKVYRDLDFVRCECARLAGQIARAASNGTEGRSDG